MDKHLVLVGGGHAHLVTIANLHLFLERGHRVSVIGPSIHHYYSGMGPGMLGKIYMPDDIRFQTKHMVEKQGGTFILGKVTRIDPDLKTVCLESGESVPYDVLSFNAGSYIPETIIKQKSSDLFLVKPIEKLINAQKRIIELSAQKQISIGIVGGGPSAVEIAGNSWRLVKVHCKNRPVIKVFSGRGLMTGFPKAVRKRIYRSFNDRDIEISENDYVKEIKGRQVILESGKSHELDFIFMAVGIKPSPIFKESGLHTGPDGALLVNRYLQSIKHPEIFGGGDCIYFQDQPLDKVGVYAVRENPILYHNLMASLEGGELEPFEPGRDYLLIFNLGDGSGIFHKKWVTFGGKFAFLIKDYIDRRFMKKFQSI